MLPNYLGTLRVSAFRRSCHWHARGGGFPHSYRFSRGTKTAPMQTQPFWGLFVHTSAAKLTSITQKHPPCAECRTFSPANQAHPRLGHHILGVAGFHQVLLGH